MSQNLNMVQLRKMVDHSKLSVRIESKNYEQIKALQEEAKLLKERIEKLEAK